MRKAYQKMKVNSPIKIQILLQKGIKLKINKFKNEEVQLGMLILNNKRFINYNSLTNVIQSKPKMSITKEVKFN